MQKDDNDYEFWYQIKIDSRKGRRARLTFKRVITLCPSMLEIIARQSVITLSYFEAIWILGGRAIVGRGNWKSKVCANTKQSNWTDWMLARTKTNILSDSIALLGSDEDLAKIVELRSWMVVLKTVAFGRTLTSSTSFLTFNIGPDYRIVREKTETRLQTKALNRILTNLPPIRSKKL